MSGVRQKAIYGPKCIVAKFGGLAGAPLLNTSPAVYEAQHAKLEVAGARSDNIYAPFESKLDWCVAHWAKTCGPTSSALTDLLGIDEVCAPSFCSRLKV